MANNDISIANYSADDRAIRFNEQEHLEMLQQAILDLITEAEGVLDGGMPGKIGAKAHATWLAKAKAALSGGMTAGDPCMDDTINDVHEWLK